MIQRMNKAMTKRRDAVMAGEKEQGFTLIELMVVIIIIGILAAIAIPVFLNQRQQAWTASVKSDLASASLAAEAYAVSNKGSYANLTKALLVTNGFKETPGNTLVVGAVTATTYVFTDTNSNISGTTWTDTTGVVSP
jgi:type IV pilus assembly protein PilA